MDILLTCIGQECLCIMRVVTINKKQSRMAIGLLAGLLIEILEPMLTNHSIGPAFYRVSNPLLFEQLYNVHDHKYSQCSQIVIVVPLGSKCFTLVYDSGWYFGAICTDSNHNSDVLSISISLLVLNFSPRRTKNALLVSTTWLESSLICSPNAILFYTQCCYSIF
jgi:hypothetical protein